MWAEPRESVEQVPCVVTHKSPLVPTYGVTILGPIFHFLAPHLFPKTFLAKQPLISHLPSSHMVPRSTTYPPGLPRYPSKPIGYPKPRYPTNRELHHYLSIVLYS